MPVRVRVGPPACLGLPSRIYSIALDALVDAGNVVLNRPAVEAGMAVLNAGGDFVDGLIAFEGRWLGGETFVFLRKRQFP